MCFSATQEVEANLTAEQRSDPSMWPGQPELVRVAAAEKVAASRSREMSEFVAELFQFCEERCTCEPTRCRLRSSSSDTAAAASVKDAPGQVLCLVNRDCVVCRVFVKHQNEFARLTGVKNARMTKQLVLCSLVFDLYEETVTGLSGNSMRERKSQVQLILSKMLGCKVNRLNCMRNVGQLAKLVPRILCVQLTGGYSEFWDEIRKLAKAVNKQPTRECKLAALIAIRRKLPHPSKWKHYLTTENASEELTVINKFQS